MMYSSLQKSGLSRSKSLRKCLHFIFIVLSHLSLEYQEMLCDIVCLKFSFISHHRLQTIFYVFSSLPMFVKILHTWLYSNLELTTSYTKSTSYFEMGSKQNFPRLILTCLVLTLMQQIMLNTHSQNSSQDHTLVGSEAKNLLPTKGYAAIAMSMTELSGFYTDEMFIERFLGCGN